MVLGAHDLTVPESSKQLYRVDKLFFHPSFGLFGEYDSDFTLLKLKASNQDQDEAMNFSPICLPKSSYEVVNGASAVGLGWGTTIREGQKTKFGV